MRVTKDNLEAPWLSFEAGALSKTMEKAFVNPFLFNIKRSEVQGPILQFQSTIFEKDDIKKMVKTLNKACGEASIPDARLDKSFDVWYPTLEAELNRIKENDNSTDEKSEETASVHSAEILEEILELSRDNQKLLRSPDAKVSDDIQSVKDSLEELARKNAILYDNRRINKKYYNIFFEEILHMNHGRGIYGFLMTLSLFNADFPWIYDMGKALIDVLKSKATMEEKSMAVKDFKEMIDFTCNHPIMREMYGRTSDGIMLLKEFSYLLMGYLDDISEQYIRRVK